MTNMERLILNGLGAKCKQVSKTKFIITSDKSNRQSIVNYSVEAKRKTQNGWTAITINGIEPCEDREKAISLAAKYVTLYEEKNDFNNKKIKNNFK